jgi:hypothetical protein
MLKKAEAMMPPVTGSGMVYRCSKVILLFKNRPKNKTKTAKIKV